MTRRLVTHFTLLFVTTLALTALAGCKMKYDPEDLEIWRPSAAKNGLEKLSEWIADPGQKMPTRIRAAEILIEEEYAYAVGQSLDKAPAADRVTIMNALMPTIKEWYAKDDASIDNYNTNDSKKILAKDAAYELMRHGSDEQKAAFRGFLLDWLQGGNILERDQMGKVQLGELIELFGAEAAPPLLKALEDPQFNKAQIVSFLEKIDDADVKRKTAQSLVTQANKTMPKLSPNLRAALILVKHEALVPLFVRVVPNEALPAEFRSTALERIKEIKGPASTPIFLNWIKNEGELLRWVSIQAVAESRGKAGLGPIFANLPTDKPYGGDDPEGFKGDAERLCSEEVKKEMEGNKKEKTEPIFINQLKNGSWPAKAISLACLQFVGTAQARPAVKALLKSKTPVPAWGEDVKTLGNLAKITLDKLPK